MRISVSWLKEFVDFDLTPDELAERLTFHAVAVELVDRFRQVVVGRVTAVTPHPGADHLKICRVAVGGERSVEVVCGAPNVREGGHYATALAGARLAGGRVVEVETFRGVTSEAMLCSEAELGVGDEAGQLLEMSNGQVGQPLADVLDLDEAALELDVTANRGDLLSHLGVAREAAALVGGEVRLDDRKPNENGGDIDEAVRLAVEDREGCPQYLGRVIEGVKIGPSPPWLVRRLESLGQRAINTVVDVTNLILLELGTPLHAFDLEKIKGREVLVRNARGAEVLVTLDGQSRSLAREMTVIADRERAMAIGGVMGGAETEVGDGTMAVFLECARFDPPRIQATSRRLGLSTEASLRFSRGVDGSLLELAIDRASALIQGLTGGRVARGRVAVGEEPPRRTITLRPARARTLIGVDLTGPQMIEHLERYGLKAEGEDPIRVEVPSFRPDLSEEVDLIEEVARSVGFDQIPSSSVVAHPGTVETPAAERLRKRVVEVLTGLGFDEAYTTSFLLAALQDRFIGPDRVPVRVVNPVAAGGDHLRSSLLPGLLECLARNWRRGQENVRLFELGTVFWQDGEEIREELSVAAVACGRRDPVFWGTSEERLGFFEMKGAAEDLASVLRTPRPAWHPIERSFLQPGRGALSGLTGKEWGVVGELHPDLVEALDLTAPVGVLEVRGELLDSGQVGTCFRAWSEYPAVVRDLSLLIDEGTPAGEVLEVAKSVEVSLLEGVELFDCYQGPQVPQGKRSLALRLTYRAPDRTLSDEQVGVMVEQVVRALQDRAGAELRT